MGSRFTEISQKHQDFIAAQHIFFVATATSDSRINLSPKGMDSFRVLGPNRVAWLNVTGSGNETAAHLQTDTRMTIMFCAFVGAPNILRLYGTAIAVHRGDSDWSHYLSHFTELPGTRQIFVMDVDLVQTSCGMSVPEYEYCADRDQLNRWAVAKGELGIAAYWEEKNQLSIDGVETGIVAKQQSAELA